MTAYTRQQHNNDSPRQCTTKAAIVAVTMNSGNKKPVLINLLLFTTNRSINDTETDLKRLRSA